MPALHCEWVAREQVIHVLELYNGAILYRISLQFSFRKKAYTGFTRVCVVQCH